jgi:predicted Zn finger-like uncharacterized protein
VVIRCKTCHGSVWVEYSSAPPDGRAVRTVCEGCGQRYELGSPPTTAAARKLSNDARRLAREKSIDLPAAYSVLLGVIKIDEVFEVSSTVPPEPTPAGKGKGKADTTPVTYDPAFTEAVESGRLTPKQAMARGRRAAYAALLASRYKMPMVMAFAVTDNRMPLLQAIRRQGGGAAHPPVQLQVRSGHLPRAVWMLLVLLPVAAAAAALSGGRNDSERGSPGIQSRTVGTAEVRSDSRGTIVQISATDPNAVLTAYCIGADPLGRLDVLGVVPGPSDGTRTRLGVFRRPNEPSSPMMIKILEDLGAGHWVAGDGQSAVPVSPAPPELAAPLEAAAGMARNSRLAPAETPEVKSP